MSSADNIALYRRLIEEFDRPEVIDELLAPGIELPTFEGTGVEPTPKG